MMRTTRRLLASQLVWHGLAILALSCLPMIKWQMALWNIPRRSLISAVLLIGTYCLSAILVMWLVREPAPRGPHRAAAITFALFALCLFGLLVLRIETPRYVLVPVFLTAALIPLSVGGPAARGAGSALILLGCVAVAFLLARALAWHRPPEVQVKRAYLKTGFYNLQVTTRLGVIPTPATRGGGLDQIGDRVLLGTGDGHLYVFSVPSGNSAMNIVELPTIVPSNREEFARAWGGSSVSPTRAIDYSEKGPPRVQTWRFRVADVIAQDRGDRVRLYASHHYWREDKECFVVRVSVIEAAASALERSIRNAQWQTLFESTPCVPLKGELRKRGKNPFKGEEAGGRMALVDENTLLLTLGDHGFYGLESLQIFAQDPNASYGKTIRIDLNTGNSEIFTLGHRNPQGLFVAPGGQIWLTEHGSQGGDELNLLAQGTNYGWPIVTYGTEYGAMAWPLSQDQGRHDGFAQPIYAWLPSIGVSTLTGLNGPLFPIWRDNLLAGSLATRSLYRLVLDGERVVLDEQIELGQRVRDVLALRDGRLLVWTDDAALLTIEPASGTDGAATFATMCLGCHQAVDGISHRIGPDLFGIAGREIGNAEGYDEYSDALRSHSGRWTREHLDAFLRDPQAFAPGTTMAFPGIADDKQRAELLDYLESLDD